VEVERLGVAQELHDGPMQEIYGLMYRISLVKDITDDPGLGAEIDFTLDKLKEINDELRNITRELRPTTLTPFGLEKAIREHSDRFDQEHPELSLSLDLMADGTRLPEHMRLTLFRIYQIAVTNVIRHAQAKNVSVRFSFDEDTIQLEIEDDGKGFEAPKRLRTLAAKGHFGLPGAAERAEAIGGKLEVVSAPGRGTRLQVTAPLVDKSTSDLRAAGEVGNI
jgi:signal transduction histidine kinase